MRREKRTAQLKAHVPPSLREQYELFKAEEANGNVLSMSDFLFGVFEEYARLRPIIRSSQHKPMRRAG
jgi:hypothetical protein